MEGPSEYLGVFTYFHGVQVDYVLVEVSPKTTVSSKGYARLLDISSPGRMSLPAAYSYSRYQGRDLRLFNGTYPYATRMDDAMYQKVYVEQVCHLDMDGYSHFVNG